MPQIPEVIYLLATRQVCHDRESLSQKNSSIASMSELCTLPGLVACSPKELLMHLCCAHILVARACLFCAPGSVVGDIASLSCGT